MNYIKEISDMLGLDWDYYKNESEEFIVREIKIKVYFDSKIGLVIRDSNYIGSSILYELLRNRYTVQKITEKEKVSYSEATKMYNKGCQIKSCVTGRVYSKFCTMFYILKDAYDKEIDGEWIIKSQ